jgi:cytochrome b pre-mRNA-processing protein 3
MPKAAWPIRWRGASTRSRWCCRWPCCAWSAEALKAPALLTELFVTDMDGQLRESGVGDMVVGKHIGRLMSVLGGRLGAYREALASDDPAVLAAGAQRDLREGASPAPLAAMARALADRLAALPDEAC